MRSFWRLTGWGGAATLALATVALTTQTHVGVERLQFALAKPATPARAVASLPEKAKTPEKDPETRALEAQVRTLAADRERLALRLATLERHLDDMTGSIARQAAQQAATAQPAPAPTPVASQPAAPPQPADLGAAAAASAAATMIAPAPVAPTIDPLAMAPGKEVAASWPDTGGGPQAAPPLTEVKEIVPLPQARLAALPAAEPAPPRPAGPRHEFGIELASAPDMESLRKRWAAVKANYGPLLAGLQPVAVHESPAGGSKYRLIAGPLANFTVAKQMCVRFTAAGGSCRPARFDPNTIVQH